MKRILAILVALTVVTALIPAGVFAQAESARYTVVFTNTRIPGNAAQLVANAGGELIKTLPQVGVGVAVSSNPDFAADLRGASGIHSVGLMRYQALPATEVYELEGHASTPTGADALYFLYQWDIRRVKADQAWSTTSGSHDTVVSVIDTGVARNHPDLAPNVIYWDCFSSTGVCSAYPDLHWHGTHVAGTVAAAFDHGLAVGVGPDLGIAGYNVFEIIPGCGLCAYDGPIWEAMMDTAHQGFDVINMSLGGFVIFPASQADVATWTAWNRVADYVTRQGVTIVASAGNADFDLNGPVAHIPSDLPNVISVGATGIRPDPVYPQAGSYDVRAFYSNFGAALTMSAPGGDCGLDDSCDPLTRPANWFEYLVLSTYVFASPACAASASCPTTYAWAGGTSMASPHVAGVAGLVKDNDPSLNANQIRSILKRTAESLGDRQQFGHGMVDAKAAVEE